MPEGPVKVIFMGSPEFAVPTLDAIVSDTRFHVVLIVTQPDRPKGRGKRLAPTPVREYAAEHGLSAVTMTKHDYAEVVRRLAALGPDFVVVASFGIILKKDLLELPRYGCVNLHPSLLPKYRGVSPIQAAILAGDEETGCTTMLMDEGVDTGPTLLAESLRIDRRDTAGTLELRLAALGASLVVSTLEGMIDGSVQPAPQRDGPASYTRKIKKEQGAIDWSEGAEMIARHIRAMTPWPSAYTRLREKRVIVLEGEPVSETGGGRSSRATAEPPQGAAAAPGVIVSSAPLVVATGEGSLRLLRVKIEGKKDMDARAFVSGYRVEPGDRFD